MLVIPEAARSVLSCPVCGAGLDVADRALRCPAGHTFDLARQGYVNLLSGHKPGGTADTAAMVAARAEFLAAGHYAPIADAVAEIVAGPANDVAGPANDVAGPANDVAGPANDVAGPANDAAGVVVDVGGGTGYYLGRMLDALPSAAGITVDVSTYALRRAARAHPRMVAVGADVWRGLPVRDASAAVVVDIFAPRNAPEFRRILRPDGVLVVVTPTAEHLAELVAGFGLLTVDERKDERVDQALAHRFTLHSRREVTFALRLGAADVERLIRMGPSAHHLDDGVLREQLDGLAAPVEVTASVQVSCYRPQGQRSR